MEVGRDADSSFARPGRDHQETERRVLCNLVYDAAVDALSAQRACAKNRGEASCKVPEDKLQKQLRTHFELEEHDMSSLRVLAATLDPRFRCISFLNDDEKEELQSVLKDLCATRLGAEDESVIAHL